jgi:anti-sigma regulatory factor (Ser/Thr protein kinase)
MAAAPGSYRAVDVHRAVVEDRAQAAQVSRLAERLAAQLGFGASRAGEVAVVCSEAAHNVVAHGRGGRVTLRHALLDGQSAVEILAVDAGPGLASVAASVRDGHSTGGTMGTGLGAVRRLADWSDVWSLPDEGTVLVARLVADRRTGAGASRAGASSAGVGDGAAGSLGGSLAERAAGVTWPHPQETECGDAWGVFTDGAVTGAVLVDGLGHGPAAAEPAVRAVVEVLERRDPEPAAALERVHQCLRGTRGAAVAIAVVDAGRAELRFAGGGNVSAWLVADGRRRGLVSQPGIVGGELRRVLALREPWPPGARLVLHTDGVKATGWPERAEGSLTTIPPLAWASRLVLAAGRASDDAGVVVVGS